MAKLMIFGFFKYTYLATPALFSLFFKINVYVHVNLAVHTAVARAMPIRLSMPTGTLSEEPGNRESMSYLN